ncbi:autotransporter outer membrane beta-barrel domain-containing protein [Pseudomonas sp. LRF_L74]|uniref:autotransporter outer membrane beta-barrel domain-containing protein n=1 Tax=Pseudomonas sp. LRF_L74 TaxID=3369422 RepID=UPI003F6279AB
MLRSFRLRPLPLALALQATACASSWAAPAGFAIDSGTDTSSKTLAAGETGTIASGAALSTSSSPSLTLTNGSGTITLINDGTLANTSDGRAIDNNSNNAVIAITNNGTVSSVSNDALRINKANSTLVLNNNGSIVVTGEGTDGGQAIDMKSATGSGAKVINNGSSSNASALIESHNNDAIRPGTNTTINNYGSILASGAVNTKCPDYLGDACDDAPGAHDAIDAGSNTGLVVNNWGTISGARHGITADVELNVTNYAGGEIIGRNGSGVGSDGTGTVTNYGLISGRYAGAGNVYDHLGDGSTTSNGDGDGVDIDGVATIVNYGRIEGLGAGGYDSSGYPNGADGIAAGGGSIVNHEGASIYGESKGILIDDGANGTAVASGRGTDSAAASTMSIDNAGSIIGERSTAIGLVGDFDDEIVNRATGVIRGGTESVRVDELNSSTAAAAVQMGAGNDTLSNAGLIEGLNDLAVDLGEGDDTLKVYSTASFIGSVDGGAGTDSVILDDSAGGSFGDSVNFEALDVRSGSWTLDSNDFSSSVHVYDGAGLLNLGTLLGNVQVDAGGVFSGGNVSGNLDLQSGSTLALLVTPTTSNALSVGGDVTLAGASLSILGGSGEYALQRTYSVLTATGSISGTFAETQSNLAFLTPTLSYGAHSVDLTLTRNDIAFADLAQSANGSGVARSLEAQGSGALYQAVLGSGTGSVSGALEQLAASSNASLMSASLAGSAQVGSSMLGAMQQMGSAGNLQASLLREDGPLLASNGVPDEARHLNDPRAEGRLWLQALGSHGTLDGGNGGHDVRQDTRGAVLGADWALNPTWRLGVLGGYARTDVDAGLGASSDIDSLHVGVYALRQSGPLALRLGAAYSRHDNSSKRRVGFSGFNDQLRGDYAADSQQAFAELGYQLAFGRLLTEPFASLGYQRYSHESYNEKGGAAALHVDSQDQDNFSSTLGIRLAHLGTLANGMSLTPRASLGWRHTYGDLDSTARQSFLSGGSAFSVEGTAMDRDSLLLEAGLDLGISASQSLGLGYSGEYGNRAQNHALIGQWQMKF